MGTMQKPSLEGQSQQAGLLAHGFRNAFPWNVTTVAKEFIISVYSCGAAADLHHFPFSSTSWRTPAYSASMYFGSILSTRTKQISWFWYPP